MEERGAFILSILIPILIVLCVIITLVYVIGRRMYLLKHGLDWEKELGRVRDRLLETFDPFIGANHKESIAIQEPGKSSYAEGEGGFSLEDDSREGWAYAETAAWDATEGYPQPRPFAEDPPYVAAWESEREELPEKRDGQTASGWNHFESAALPKGDIKRTGLANAVISAEMLGAPLAQRKRGRVHRIP